MVVYLTPEQWAQIRYEYEHTDKPTEDICADYGFSSGTLRDRVRRWGWTRRNPPIRTQGPPPMPPLDPAPPLAPAMAPAGEGEFAAAAAAPAESLPALPAPGAASSEAAPPDPAEIVPRLQSAITHVLPAIEAALANFAGGPMPPREMERAARTLTALTTTLEKLSELLERHQANDARVSTDDVPDNMDEFRMSLVQRIEALVANRDDESAPSGSTGDNG